MYQLVLVDSKAKKLMALLHICKVNQGMAQHFQRYERLKYVDSVMV